MYQLLIRLEVRHECAWESMYHRKIRGRLGQALQRAGIERYRDTSQSPFVFSDLMPDDQAPGSDLKAGSVVRLLVGAKRMDVLEAIATDFQDRPEVTAGAMVFDARAAKPLETDVGDVGSTGTLTTASGIIPVVDNPGPDETGAPTYWSERDHCQEAFKKALHQSISGILAEETEVEAPSMRLFDGYDHIKTYGVEVDVTASQTITVVASKWNLRYEVRDESHREALNTLLGTGVGSTRSYGFGMLQTRDDMKSGVSA